MLIRAADTSQIKSEPSGPMGTHKSDQFPRMHPDDSLLSYTSYGWPIRSVEQLTPYVPKKLANPVLLVGNTVRAFRSQTDSFMSLTTTIPRVTLSHHTQMRRIPPRCSVTTLTCSSNSGSATRVLLRPRPVLRALSSTTSHPPRLVLLLMYADFVFTLTGFPIPSFRVRALPSVRLIIKFFSLP